MEQGWLYTTVFGHRENYNRQGQLQRIRYANSVEHVLTYVDGQLQQITDSRGPQIKLHYSDHWLSWVELPNGQALRYRYSEQGNLQAFQKMANSLGSQFAAIFENNTATYHYENSHYPHGLTGISDAEGQRFATWGYDELGRANFSEHGEGVERFNFDYRNDNSVAVTNAAGLVTIYHLEASRPGYRRLVSVEGLATPTCPQVRQYHRYNQQGFLKLAIDAEGRALKMQRNARGLITDQQDGLISQAEQWLPVQGAARIERRWHPRYPLVTEVIYSSFNQGEWQAYRKSHFDYSDAGRLLKRTDTDLSQQTEPYTNYGNQRSWTYSYTLDDSHANRLSSLTINGPREALADGSDDIVTRYFNSQGLLSRVVNPLGQSINISAYNDNGLATEVIMANGLKVSLAYNLEGQLTSLTRHGDRRTETVAMDYFRHGLLKTINHPDGSWQKMRYNDARQLVEVTNNWGESLVITPSKVSGAWTEQVIYASDGSVQQKHQRSLDSLGRVLKLLGQHGQQVALSYNGLGNVTGTIEHGENTVRTTNLNYDALNRVSDVVDALGSETHFSYALHGAIAQVTDANNAVTRYQYNGFGDTIELISADTGKLIYYYDSAGNKIKSVSGEAGLSDLQRQATATHFKYDLINRLIEIDYPGEKEDVRYQYDQTESLHEKGIGQLTQIVDGSGVIRYGYDNLGNIITDQRRFTLNDKTQTYTLRYQYTAGNKIAGVTYPNGQKLNYHYNHDRLKAITVAIDHRQNTLVDQLEYQAFGAASRWQYGNQLWQSKTVDSDGRIQSVQLQGREDLWQQHYQYDLFDTMTGIKNAAGDGRQFNYDAMARLIAERDSMNDNEQRYSYDAVGNRLNKTVSSSSVQVNTSYQPHSNRIQTYGDTEVLLSASGNTLVESSPTSDRRHVYNRQNQIVATYQNFELKGSYAYNALGQRSHKMTPTDAGLVHTVFHYGLSGQLLAETKIDTITGQQTYKNYFWLNRKPIALFDSASEQPLSYIHTDHLNTPRLATNSEQSIVWRWQSDAFGVGNAELDPDGDGQQVNINLRFAGQYFDEESELFYNYHRYYDPNTGRYNQSDPIGLGGGVNSYAYVSNNPLSNTDPLGLFLFAFDGTGNDDSNLIGWGADAKTNVSFLRTYHDGFNPGESYYQAGVATGGLIDYVAGIATGLGSRKRVNNALDKLDTLIQKSTWNRIIDVVGFSRGAAAAREFVNDVFERVDNNHWANVTKCNPLQVRFMGLFDTVGSMGIAGNSIDFTYDFTVDPRIGHVAHAIALNEHRTLFPLSSISPVAGATLNTGNIVEQGFIGAHSDIGGGYADGDLSDVALQWMYKQAVSVGVGLSPLLKEHKNISDAVVHDQRKIIVGLYNEDRAIYYPDDPFAAGNVCAVKVKGHCVQYATVEAAQRQKTAPQFEDLQRFIIDTPNSGQSNVRGKVDSNAYINWLNKTGVL